MTVSTHTLKDETRNIEYLDRSPLRLPYLPTLWCMRRMNTILVLLYFELEARPSLFRD